MRTFVLFLLTLLLAGYSVKGQSNDVLYLRAVETQLTNGKDYTLKVAELMPADLYHFKPSVEEMDFRQQLLHLAVHLVWISSTHFQKVPNNFVPSDFEVQGKDSVISAVSNAYDFAIENIKKLPVKDLSDTVSFFAGDKTKIQMLNLILDHQTHHRAQLIVYLRLNALKPPAYVGW